MIERARQINAAGHSIFFSQAVINDYPAQLTSFYDVAGEGHAPNPNFGPDWRPAPIVATESNPASDKWTVSVSQPSRYRVVAKIGNFWEELSTAPFSEGDTILTVPGASEVELLLDRRPLNLADFNGDGLVDSVDYAFWRESLGSTLDLRADATGDGLVNSADLTRWRNDYGAVVASAVKTPEPSTLGLISSLLIILWKRRCPY